MQTHVELERQKWHTVKQTTFIHRQNRRSCSLQIPQWRRECDHHNHRRPPHPPAAHRRYARAYDKDRIGSSWTTRSGRRWSFVFGDSSSQETWTWRIGGRRTHECYAFEERTNVGFGKEIAIDDCGGFDK